MNSPTLLVLAAGMGSRYGGLKQIDAVGPNGETIIDYSMYDAIRAGFEKIVFVIRRSIEQQFKQSIGARFEKVADIHYVFQELENLPLPFSVPLGRTKPWGTTHAVLAAADKIHEPFAVINADDFYGAQSYRALVQHLKSGTSDNVILGFVLRNTLSEFGSVARGICQVSDDNYLERITELTSIQRDGSSIINTDPQGQSTVLSGDESVSMNMWGFTPKVFPGLRQQFEEFLHGHGSESKSESYLPTAVNALVASHQTRVKVLLSHDSWFGVTYREDRPLVVESIARLIESGAYRQRLWS